MDLIYLAKLLEYFENHSISLELKLVLISAGKTLPNSHLIVLKVLSLL